MRLNTHLAMRILKFIKQFKQLNIEKTTRVDF